MTNLARAETGGLQQIKQEALDLAGDLLAHLGPLFPVISSAARSDAGAAAWIKSWATQIHLSGIKKWQIERGLARLHEHDPNIPLSWPSFYSLCKRASDDDGPKAERLWRLKQADPVAYYMAEYGCKIEVAVALAGRHR